MKKKNEHVKKNHLMTTNKIQSFTKISFKDKEIGKIKHNFNIFSLN